MFNQNKQNDGQKIFRKIAQLMASSGSLVGNMFAITMLNDEHYLSSALEIKNWPLISGESIMAYKRASWFWAGIFRHQWVNSYSEQFLQYMLPQTGVCAGVFETISGVTMAQEYLEPHFPFESDYSENITKSINTLRYLLNSCNMNAYEVFLSPSNPAPISAYFQSIGVEGKLIMISSRVPYVRKAVGLILQAISYVNFLKFYDEPLK